MKITQRIDKYWLLILLLFLFHSINNYIVLYLDNTPLVYDANGFFQRSINYYRNITEVFSIRTARPPLFMLISLPFYFIFGITADIAAMTNLVFLFILFSSVYGIGKRLFNQATGLLAAFILSTYPIVFGFSRIYMQDIALTAMVTLSILLLILTENFSNRKYSLLFGASAGFGMLTRHAYFIFLMGPFLYLLLSSLYRKNTDKNNAGHKKRIIINASLSFLLCFLISSLWYMPNIGFAAEYFLSGDITPHALSQIFPFSKESSLYYLWALNNSQIFPFYFILFLGSLIFLIIVRFKKIVLLLIWIITSYIITSSLGDKIPRYTIPYLPAVSVITALGVSVIKKSKIRKSFILLIVLLGLTQFFFISYMPKAKMFFHHMQITPGWKKYACQTTSKLWNIHFNINVGLLQPNRAHWKTDQILMFLKKEDVNRKKRILTIRDHIMISDPIRTQIMLEQLPFEIIYLDGAYKSIDNDISVEQLTSLIINVDYVFLSSFDFIEKDDASDEAERIFRENIGKFKLFKKIEMPDSTVFWMYANMNPAGTQGK